MKIRSRKGFECTCVAFVYSFSCYTVHSSFYFVTSVEVELAFISLQGTCKGKTRFGNPVKVCVKFQKINLKF